MHACTSRSSGSASSLFSSLLSSEPRSAMKVMVLRWRGPNDCARESERQVRRGGGEGREAWWRSYLFRHLHRLPVHGLGLVVAVRPGEGDGEAVDDGEYLGVALSDGGLIALPRLLQRLDGVGGTPHAQDARPEVGDD